MTGYSVVRPPASPGSRSTGTSATQLPALAVARWRPRSSSTTCGSRSSATGARHDRGPPRPPAARRPRGPDPVRRGGGRPARAARRAGAVDAVEARPGSCSSTSSGRPRWRCAARGSPTSLQQSREQLVLAREDDRRRIRRDLHDGLGPVLGGVAMRLDAAGNALDRDPETDPRGWSRSHARTSPTRWPTYGAWCTGCARRPSTTSACSAAARPAGGAAEHRRPGGHGGRRGRCRALARRGRGRGLPDRVEALTNTARHARARHAAVRLTGSAGRAAGRGRRRRHRHRSRRPSPESGYGRSGSGPRSSVVAREIVCPPTGGTRVRAWLPLTTDLEESPMTDPGPGR